MSEVKSTRMGAADMVKILGATGLLDSKEGFGVRVKILDAKAAFHRTDVFVQPVEGKGSAWVSLGRIALDLPTSDPMSTAPAAEAVPQKTKGKGKRETQETIPEAPTAAA